MKSQTRSTRRTRTRARAPHRRDKDRPPFILSSSDVCEEVGVYDGSTERMSFGRPIGGAAGLKKLGLHLERLPPGHRTSWPHAEEVDEEFVFVVSGTVDVWIDGTTYGMQAGDLAAFPGGTGIAHTFINDGDSDAILLVGGEKSGPQSRRHYPFHNDVVVTAAGLWKNPPPRPLGPHDGTPRARRESSRGARRARTK